MGWEFDPADCDGWAYASRDAVEYRGDPPADLLPITLRISAHRPEDLEPLPGLQIHGPEGLVDQAEEVDAPTIQTPAMRIGEPPAPPDGTVAIGLLNVSDHPIRRVGLAVEGLVLPVTVDDLPPWAPKNVAISVPRPTVVRVVSALNANDVEIPSSLLPPPLPLLVTAQAPTVAVDPFPVVTVRPEPAPAGVVGGRVTLAATAKASRRCGPVTVVASLPLHLTPVDDRWQPVAGGAVTRLDPMEQGESRRLELVCHVVSSGSGTASFDVTRDPTSST
ncbi:hypothetical protein DVS28_b0263 (plasmid) [Euzebya pacifica]|uniref:Uncharacterized protein n=2 Tax=Euzebya pacifica TaxID=1608957 RepID=A0A346Y6D6_9ACTN|nr:hypothetical protein DVS28_b0263 [Euzebya pacifica]